MGRNCIGIRKLWVFLGADWARAGALILMKLCLSSMLWVSRPIPECTCRVPVRLGWCRLRHWRCNSALLLILMRLLTGNGSGVVGDRILIDLVMILILLAGSLGPLPFVGCI